MVYGQIIVGYLLFSVLLYLLSEDRRNIDWKLWILCPLLQILAGLLIQKVPLVATPVNYLSQLVVHLDSAASKAAAFMFGYLSGGPAPFEIIDEGSGFIVAFRVLPLILVVSALSALFYHLRILPFIIEKLGIFFSRILRLNAPLGFGVAASLFFGTIETPLLIRPYLAHMTRGDLFALITCSMATIAGSVMVLYAGLVGKVLPGAIGHLITASLLSVVASIMVARMLIPVNAPTSGKEDPVRIRPETRSSFEAVIKGTQEGLDMVLKIAATIIVLFAFVHLSDSALAAIHPDLSLEGILGTLLRPVMWLAGIPWEESLAAGRLMGTKIILNEFVSYLQLSQLPPGTFSETTSAKLIYAMCGFANLGSVGIITGGLCSIIPERKNEIVPLGMKALFAGNVATLITAGMIGLLL